MGKATPAATFLRDYRPPAYQISTVDLYFSIHDEFVSVLSTMSIQANDLDVADIVLDGIDLTLISVKVNGELVPQKGYKVTPENLTIFNVPDNFILKIETRINPAENTSLEGLYLSNGVFCTQCEAEGFRKITYYIDRPDIMAVYTTTVEARKSDLPILLANGNLEDSRDLALGRHSARWHDPYKKPCYLFAMVAGDLLKIEESFTTMSGRIISLQIYVEPHNSKKCGHALLSLKKAMAWDEKVFGLEYDLDQYMILAVDDFNAGAMENKGLNIFNSKYILAEPATATDDDYEGIEAVVAHEYFHNWTGNRVTCRDWFQLSLKEGLTVFRDQEFSSDVTSRAVKRISDVRILRNHQFPEDAGPMAHPVRPESYIEINNFYTLTVYEKGSEIIRMFHTILGPVLFRRGIDLYFERHDGDAVTIEDFASAMEDVYPVENKKGTTFDFSQFCLWYSQPGTPELQITSSYDAESQTYALTVKQEKPKNAEASHSPMLIPLAIGLLDESGNDLLQLQNMDGKTKGIGTEHLLVNQKEETFVFRNMYREPIPSLLRGFSAPVNLRYDYSDDEMKFLMLHDSDTFSRWEAGQRYYCGKLMALIMAFQNGINAVIDPDVVEVFAELLSLRSELDESFLAQMLTLPSEDYLAEIMDVVDVDAIHEVRVRVRQTLARSLKKRLLDVYKNNADNSPYRYTPDLAGRRRLKNLCLSYLMELEDQEVWSIAQQQYRKATNMSDEIASLRAMVHSNCSAKEQALTDFNKKWQHEALVMDKWFAVQATNPTPGTLEQVVKLMEHPLFSIKNPNKVRALIGSFAGANPVRFHAKNGEGYEFLTDQVIALDKINPHISSRLLGRLSRWRKYDIERQQLIKLQLERVIGCESLSKGVYEVAVKCLKG